LLGRVFTWQGLSPNSQDTRDTLQTVVLLHDSTTSLRREVDIVALATIWTSQHFSFDEVAGFLP
jgi:hypothetical protein